MDGNRMTIFFHKGKSRGMGACLHSRDAALNARETGIYLTITIGLEHFRPFSLNVSFASSFDSINLHV